MTKLRDSDIHIGTVVSHSRWGLGQIIEIEEGSERLRIDFQSMPGQSMARRLALRVLDHVPEDGLEAGIVLNREQVLSWEKESPLRLVAAALVDTDLEARTSRLKDRLTTYVIDTSSWDTWWRRVQNALKESNHFRYDSRGKVSLIAKPADIEDVSWSDLPSPVRSSPSRKSDPSARLAEWVTWVQADVATALPTSFPPASIRPILQTLPLAIIPTAIDRLASGIEERLLNSSRTGPSASRAWLESIAIVLHRYSDSTSMPDYRFDDVVQLIVRILEVPDQDTDDRLVSWLAGQISKGRDRIDAVTAALLIAYRQSPSGSDRLLSEIRDMLDVSTRVTLWQQMMQPNLNEQSRPLAERVLRILDPEDRTEVLSKLLVTAPDETSLLAAGAILQNEWKRLAGTLQQRQLFRAQVLCWLSHEYLRQDAERALLEVAATDGSEEDPEGSLTSSWQLMIRRSAEHEIHQTRTYMEVKAEQLQQELRDAESELDRANRQTRHLQGEARKASHISALDISRDALLVLGNAVQQIAASPGPMSQELGDAGASIELALGSLGAEPFGEVGQSIPFEPTLHEATGSPAIGSLVTIVAPGLRYFGHEDTPVVLIRMRVRPGAER